MSSKKIDLRQLFIRFYRLGLEVQSVMLVFSTSFVNRFTLTLRQLFIRFYRLGLEVQSVMLVFSTSFVNRFTLAFTRISSPQAAKTKDLLRTRGAYYVLCMELLITKLF